MERTSLNAMCDSLGETNIQFETAQSAKAYLGAGEGAIESEGPDSRFCINIDTHAYDSDTDAFSRKIHVQLWITPSQIADIVKQYFAMTLRKSTAWYTQSLERILRKRWTVMTSPVYRMDYPPDCPRSLEPYYSLRNLRDL